MKIDRKLVHKPFERLIGVLTTSKSSDKEERVDA